LNGQLTSSCEIVEDWFWAQGWWICTATLESQGLKSGLASLVAAARWRVYAAEHFAGYDASG